MFVSLNLFTLFTFSDIDMIKFVFQQGINIPLDKRAVMPILLLPEGLKKS